MLPTVSLLQGGLEATSSFCIFERISAGLQDSRRRLEGEWVMQEPLFLVEKGLPQTKSKRWKPLALLWSSRPRKWG